MGQEKSYILRGPRNNATKQVADLYLHKPGSNTNIVFFAWMVELSQAPVYQAKFSKLMIYHNIMGLNISMHNAL
jgi:hypothetical protein